MLPLDDSITYGICSSSCDHGHGNGYRQYLECELGQSFVSYVGWVRSGDMRGNLNESHPRALINEIDKLVRRTLYHEQPSVVQIHAGTNDMTGEKTWILLER